MSKARDARFWKKWTKSGAVAIATLPGADRFYNYLCSLFPGQAVIVKAPVVVDWSYGMEFTKIYTIVVNGKKVGKYKTFGPKPGEEHAEREFQGNLPGHTNEAIVMQNRFLTLDPQQSPHKVSLVFSNRKFVNKNMHEGAGELVTTPWQRQDGWNEITQFP